MNIKRYRMISTILVFILIIGGFGLWNFFKEPTEYSQTERRYLAQPVPFSVKNFLSGDFAEEMESYLTDQFPLRDEFRRFKATFLRDILRQKDVGGYYMVDGSLSKLDEKLNEQSVNYACRKITELYEKYLKPYESQVYYCMIPDKNRYMAEVNGYPSLDYEKLYTMVRELLPMEEIEITQLLALEDYYLTDSHWRQESILDVAEKIGSAFGVDVKTDYEMVHAGEFLGVYGSQSALAAGKEALNYLMNEELKGCRVYNQETKKWSSVYDTAAFHNVDPYDIFLSGAVPLLEIENPSGDPEKELLVFRDSFGSSLVPLLVHGYGKITVIDTRYISPAILPQYIDFHGQDALFVYSTMLMNNSSGLR